ncbi:conserved Plasmodium protein, unknown function [Plasmodium gallinaceum]|uniref:Uncharacterized protein n=1 Tax=Plasmodium gallinaceum TaxID=5849 RepID=A0A1J1GNI8_PLAGA|nr:conserved Plasmodium protein, unknown function [Plasmodium gallinaceum]CRG94041.1 conserved Plasmodium protein, unknown function [Plasmodium gallinaceum]
MEVEWASKILAQLLIKEKCLKEKCVINLMKKFGDVNQIIQHMNEKLEVLGFIVNNELINGEEYLILNCEKLKNPGDNSSEKNSINVKDEYLFNSKFKKIEISLYYLIIDYIINNNKNLKIDNGEITYESLCLKLNIKNANIQKSILDKLIFHNWLKNIDEGKLALGIRFYTDLVKFFPLNNLEKCSLCNNAIIVENSKCINCFSVYHLHCFNALASNLSLCFICKNTL